MIGIGVGNVAGAWLATLIVAEGSSIQLSLIAFFWRGCMGERGAGVVCGVGVLDEGEMANEWAERF